jgi:hypothetical protein
MKKKISFQLSFCLYFSSCGEEQQPASKDLISFSPKNYQDATTYRISRPILKGSKM